MRARVLRPRDRSVFVCLFVLSKVLCAAWENGELRAERGSPFLGAIVSAADGREKYIYVPESCVLEGNGRATGSLRPPELLPHSPDPVSVCLSREPEETDGS